MGIEDHDKEMNIACSLSALIKIMASFIRELKIAGHYAGCFTHTVLVNPHDDPTETVISLLLFYRRKQKQTKSQIK